MNVYLNNIIVVNYNHTVALFLDSVTEERNRGGSIAFVNKEFCTIQKLDVCINYFFIDCGVDANLTFVELNNFACFKIF